MQTVTDIPIRFVSANSILNNLTSPLFMLICLAIVIACAGVLVYIFCKKTSMRASYANLGTSDSTSASPNLSAKSLGIAGFNKKSKIALILIAAAFLACIAALTCTALNDKAIADSQSDLDSHEIIAYVDENDGDITLKNGALINNGSDGVEVIGVEPQQTTIKGKAVTINLNSDDVELYSNEEENNTQLGGEIWFNTSSEETLDGTGVLNESYDSDTNNEGVTSNSSDDLSNEGCFTDSDDAEDLDAKGTTSSNQQKGNKSSTKPVDQSGTPSKEIIVDPNGGSIPISGSIKGLNSDDVKDIVDTYAPAAVTVTTKNQTNEMCIKKINGFAGGRIFLPAFNNASELIDKGIMFYEDEQGTKPFDIINNLVRDQDGCSMKDLSYGIQYAKKNGDSIYAKAPVGTKFYATVEARWDEAFGPLESNITYHDFSDSFKNKLISLGLPTTSVYTLKSGDVDYGYWDVPNYFRTSLPTLNGVEYKSFADSYASLLSNQGGDVWASHAVPDSATAHVFMGGFRFSPSKNCWDGGLEGTGEFSEGLVLTLNFDTPNAITTSQDSNNTNGIQEPSESIQKVGWYGDRPFFPVFQNSQQLIDNHVTFYKETSDKSLVPYDFFNDIIYRECGCNMNLLSIAYDLAKSRGNEIYAQADPGYKFYGYFLTEWQDPFLDTNDTIRLHDFNEDYKKALRDLGLPTTSVYTAEPGDSDYGNWDCAMGQGAPTINGIEWPTIAASYTHYITTANVWTSFAEGYTWQGYGKAWRYELYTKIDSDLQPEDRYWQMSRESVRSEGTGIVLTINF